MRSAVFCDLDGTLVHSGRDLAGLARSDLHALEQVSGRPGAYVTRRAWDLLAQLCARTLVVPTTTRTVRQLRRLRWPGPMPVSIASNGYRVEIDGQQDLAWSSRCRRRAGDLTVPRALKAVVPVARAARARVHVRDDVFVSVVGGDQAAVGRGLAVLVDDGWAVHPGERALQVVPGSLTKEAAAAHVAERLGIDLTLALGNEPIDLGLLVWARWAALRAGAVDPPRGVRTVETPGPLGAEQVLDAVLVQLGEKA